MAYYRIETRLSPNYTPRSQSQAVYGRIREILYGAGHWWGLWQSNYTHAGVINTFLNPARQASAHEVIGDRLVTIMVQPENIAWATNSANPFTYAYEVDPQIMHRWRSGATAAQREKANRIFETVAQRMADTNRHKMSWFPHKRWFPTQCNDINWNEIRNRAAQIIKERSKPAITWIPMDVPRKMIASKDVRVYDLGAKQYIGGIIKKGTSVEFRTKTSDGKWLRSTYSTQKNLNHGLELKSFNEAPAPIPEWQKNLVDIKDLKLYVLPANGTPVYNLNTMKAIPDSVLPKGTAVDIAKKTTVNGKSYLISNYSSTNAMPNGILADHLGEPEKPPVNEKPSWYDSLEDIQDVTMYTRAEVPLVNLLTGDTIKMLPINTPVEIASYLEWHGQKYFVSKYATDSKQPNGIQVVHLSDDPISKPDEPIEPSPEQPSLEDRVNVLEAIINKIRRWLNEKFGLNL